MKRLLTFISVSILLIGYVTWPDTTNAATEASYNVSAGAVFNNPLGDDRERNKILQKIVSATDHAQKNSTIHIATYSLNSLWVTNHLISAHKRGVNVKYITDDHYASPELKKLKKALGTNTKKSSFVKVCKGGCMSSDPSSMMHAKFYLFSKSGESKNVAIMSSSNLTMAAASESWNNAYATVGNAPIYKSYVDYFNAMLPDKDRTNYDQSVADAKFKTYFYPQEWREDETNDTARQILNNTSCSGAAKKHGYNGGAIIRVAMYTWSKTRLKLAEKLWDMDNAGCDVQVIIGTDYGTDPEIITALLKKGGRYGGVKLYRGVVPKKGSRPMIYMHHKYFIISGKYLSDPATKLIVTSSLNFQNLPQRTSNENMLKVTDDRAYQAYADNFSLIRDHYSTRVTDTSAASVNKTQIPVDLSNLEDLL